jgi:hypothetical protein
MLAILGLGWTAISGFFGGFFSNIKDILIIVGVILALAIGGYVWYKLSSDASTITTLTENNNTLTSDVKTLQTTTAALQKDIVNVQAATAQANANIQTIETKSAKTVQTIQSTNYNSEAATNSANLTTSVNLNIGDIFNQIQTESVIPQAGTSK